MAWCVEGIRSPFSGVLLQNCTCRSWQSILPGPKGQGVQDSRTAAADFIAQSICESESESECEVATLVPSEGAQTRGTLVELSGAELRLLDGFEGIASGADPFGPDGVSAWRDAGWARTD